MLATSRWLTALIVAVTSAAVLVLEVVAVRLVAPYVGLTLESYTAAIAVALLGIALGARGGGMLADAVSPQRWLGPAVFVGGVLVLTVRPLVHLSGPGIQSAGGGPVGSVLLVALSTLAPVVVLSAVSPGAVKLRLLTLEQTGTVVGRLSSLGTLGALVGSVATGFVLLARLSTTQVLGLTGGILIALGLVASGPKVWAVPALGVALLPAAGLVAVDGPCARETAYYCARVDVDPQRASGRTLVLDDLRHSYVDLADPTNLGFGYTQWIGAAADALLARDRPVSALHVGGGGFTMPRWLAATHPGSRSTVLELDPDIVAIARSELGLVTSDALRVVTGDARRSLTEQPDATYDLVIGDAFGSLSVPWHLATREFVTDVRRTMRPDGAYVANIIDRGPLDFLRAELATVGKVFANVALIAASASLDGPVRYGGNFVLVASNSPLPIDALDAALPRLNAPAELVHGERLTALVGDASALTDDKAPVDQLLTTRVAAS